MIPDNVMIVLALALAHLLIGFGFILGYYANIIKWRKFTRADFIQALIMMLTWLDKAYKLNKDRKKSMNSVEKQGRTR